MCAELKRPQDRDALGTTQKRRLSIPMDRLKNNNSKSVTIVLSARFIVSWQTPSFVFPHFLTIIVPAISHPDISTGSHWQTSIPLRNVPNSFGQTYPDCGNEYDLQTTGLIRYEIEYNSEMPFNSTRLLESMLGTVGGDKVSGLFRLSLLLRLINPPPTPFRRPKTP